MIVVVGATGATGSHLVNTLAQKGLRPRAVVRNLALAKERFQDRAELVSADLRDPSSFGAVLRGASAVYVAIGGATGTPELVEVESRFIDAARSAGVPHYVRVSGIDARPDGDAEIQRIHGRIEQHLIRSGLPYTILRPCFFMQNFLALAGAIQAGTLPFPTHDGRAGLIDARDIAEVAAEVLSSQGHTGAVYTLTGPELLSHADAAVHFSRILERPISFIDVPREAFAAGIAGVGAPAWFAELLTDVYVNVFGAKKIERLSPDVERVLRRRPRSLAEFIREHRLAFAPTGQPS